MNILIWIMLLHFAPVPKRVDLKRTPSSLLQQEPYAFSRHPMYLAKLGLLFGWTIFYVSAAVLIAFLMACAYFNIIHVPAKSALWKRVLVTHIASIKIESRVGSK